MTVLSVQQFFPTAASVASLLQAEAVSPCLMKAISPLQVATSSTPPVVSAFPPLDEWINSALLGKKKKKTVITSPETIATPDNADSLHDSSILPLFSHRPVTGLRYHQATDDEVQSVTNEEVCCTSRNYLTFLINTDINQ